MIRKKPPTEPPDDEPERKERVIHTRVPESLESELRERAQELGMSVSNLVRNVLGHAFGLVGDVVADSHAIARAARGERKAIPVGQVTSIDDVLGWQPIVLAKNAVCAQCNAILPRGEDAAVGVNSLLVVCPSCLKELRS
ncbi:MAG: hypothetical protein SFX73_10305 [Kofleriaceae bacterium]|nr:hypothetical protein [Kofleriaceae bacterium]